MLGPTTSCPLSEVCPESTTKYLLVLQLIGSTYYFMGEYIQGLFPITVVKIGGGGGGGGGMKN